MPTMITTKKVLKALNSLGNKPDLIAQSLQAMGIKGQTHLAGRCPIAVFLKKEFELEDYGVTIFVQVFVGDVMMATPTPVFSFIKAFDDGHYPSLIEA